MSETVRTTCPYCGVGCGVRATADADGAVEIRGDEAHPGNAGRLCSKGSALGETVGLDHRLLYPELGRERSDWDTALTAVADGFRQVIDEHGPEAVAFYVSGQLLTEDYYVANKLMKGYLGSANIDTNSRLCMSSAVMGHKRAFGGDLVPGCYEDLELADLVVLVGSNTAWCHPIVYQRIVAARQARPEMKVVVIDPRYSATCEIADLHLPIAPGADAILFNGLLSYLDDQGVRDEDFVGRHTADAEAALAAARACAADVRAVADACGLAEADVATFFGWFAATERAVTLWSQGVNQSSSGTDKVNALINCHLLTGRIGKPGAGPFSITGQPNAMGGREVGGLATTLAAHLDIGNAEHRELVRTFWDSPVISEQPGYQAVDLFRAINEGSVKAVWIMATNPVVSLPDADAARAALEACDLVVVSDCEADTDTARLADIRLPALGWGEKDGTVTNSERTISRQRGFLPPPGEARPDWWIVCEVARRMGFADAFDYAGPHEIFDEHARLSAFGNQNSDDPGVQRGFHIGGLAGLSRAEYDALEPIQWPVLTRGEQTGTKRLFANGRFNTVDGRARFVPIDPRPPAHATDETYPLVLDTGRIRDQWHTMTRTGRSARLGSHVPEPFVEIHPQDAVALGVQDQALARVVTRWGSIVVRVRATAEVPRGLVFVPIHWNGTTASDARVGKLVNPVVDPVSGEPEFKHTPARVEPFPVEWHGFILARRRLPVDAAVYWARVTGDRFIRYELAGRERVDDWSERARAMLGVQDPDADILEVSDPSAGLYRAAHVIDDRIEACMFVSPRPDLPSRAWLSGLFVKEQLEEIDRVGLLVGAPPDPSADTGAQICACFGVGRNTIVNAIREQGLQTPEAVGEALKAGTNCGSCVPEIRALLQESAE